MINFLYANANLDFSSNSYRSDSFYINRYSNVDFASCDMRIYQDMVNEKNENIILHAMKYSDMSK